MKNKLLPLCALMAAAAAPAFAQVTVSGFVDANLESVSSGGKTIKRVSSAGLNTSRIQFKAEEDLGGGLSAKGVYEITFGADTGVQGTPRESYVQLAHKDYGDISLGRLNLTSYWIYGYADPTFSADYSLISNMMVFYAPWRESNAVQINTARVGGFQLRSTMTAGKEDGTKNGRVTSFGVDYRNGPLYAGLVTDQKHQVNIFNASKMESSRDSYLSVVYRLGAHDLTAVLHHYSGYYAYPPYVGFTSSGNTIQLGARINFDERNRLFVSLVRRNDANDTSIADATGLVVGYQYNLSKKTTLYGVVGSIRHKEDTPVRYPISWGAANPLNNENPHGAQLGIRVAF
ncbi:porin [Pelomonas sp. KK5]|uniref:porin n=1 Tax=Pelomonas sp. KK5 TaxID=1855730 RepID=UPI00097C5881|nr:porin [Pelomonas sp. KK5]